MIRLSAAIDEFVDARDADGRSEQTLKDYKIKLRLMLKAVGDVPLDSITTKRMHDYILSLRGRTAYSEASQRPPTKQKLSSRTIDSYVVSLHTFWAWASREYGCANAMSNIARPRRRLSDPKAIDKRDFVKLFQACDESKHPARDRAMLAFLADTGIRLGGLIGMTVDDLDLVARRCTVTEKGGKSRNVVFTLTTAGLLGRYLAARPAVVSRSVWLNEDGFVLTASGIAQILKRLKKRAGVEGRVNPHSFRHAFAREYLKNGGDLVTLVRLLGHENTDTTAAFYALFTQDELAELHEKYSPLKGMMR